MITAQKPLNGRVAYFASTAVAKGEYLAVGWEAFTCRERLELGRIEDGAPPWTQEIYLHPDDFSPTASPPVPPAPSLTPAAASSPSPTPTPTPAPMLVPSSSPTPAP